MDPDKFRARLADAAKNGKLNLGFCELTSLPATYIREIKAWDWSKCLSTQHCSRRLWRTVISLCG